jgi:uncharacterized protein YkwD
MNVVQYKKLGFVVVLFGLGLVGCGGGGGDNTAAAGPAPYVEPIERPAATQVAAANYGDPRRLSAFNRVNEVRKQAGIGLLAQNIFVDQAAQAHSRYQVLNNYYDHDEPFSPGVENTYTGGSSRSRIAAVNIGGSNYSEPFFSTEVISPMDFSAQTGSNMVDGLMAAPYHRSAILSPQYVDVGVGFYEQVANGKLNINFAYPEVAPQGAPDTQVVLWPVDGAVDIPASMAAEIPNPIPENNGAPAGYAASVQVNRLFLSVRDVTVFTIREGGPSGPLVSTKILSRDRGDNNAEYSFAATLPVKPLNRNTTYFVSFKGVIGKISDTARMEDKNVERNWSFTTGNKLNY